MKKLALLAAMALFVTTTFLSAQPKSPDTGAKVGAKTSDPRIETLLAMSPAERRAYLKGLSANERRGLWAKLHQTLWARRGVNPPSATGSGQYNKPIPIGGGKAKVRQKLLGTIVYDSGFPTIGFGGNQIVGNRFNTHTGIPVVLSGTVSTIQALVVPGPINTTSSAGFVLLGPQTGGGGASALFSTFTGAFGVISSVTFAGLGVSYTGSSFFVLFGDFASSYIPVVGTGTTLGQGHHAVVGYTGGAFPNITGTGVLGSLFNSYVRARGNIVPVELMTFEVE